MVEEVGAQVCVYWPNPSWDGTRAVLSQILGTIVTHFEKSTELLIRRFPIELGWVGWKKKGNHFFFKYYFKCLTSEKFRRQKFQQGFSRNFSQLKLIVIEIFRRRILSEWKSLGTRSKTSVQVRRLSVHSRVQVERAIY